MKPKPFQRRDQLGPRGEASGSASREQPVRADEEPPAPPPGLHEQSTPLARESPARLSKRVEYTHLDRVMFPLPGYTKDDVLRYYEQVAGHLLPYLRNRPITLERLPEGLDGPHFWQKNTPASYPKWIPRLTLPTQQGKPVEYVLVNDVPTLLYLVNQGAVTFHVYLSTVEHLDRPDFVLFDLDPGQSTFAEAVTAARQIHLLLAALQVPSCPKTSGKTGVHVLARWMEDGAYDQARAWAMKIAQHAAALSDIATTQRLKVKRGGRVYIDVIQNALGHHVVPPYVLRTTPQATVSMPLNWRDLKLTLDPTQFNLRTVPPLLIHDDWRDPMARLLL